MSTPPESPPTVPPQLPPPAQRSGCATAFMVLLGIILLLPGLCALLFGVETLTAWRFDPGLLVLVIFGLMVGFAGVMLIRAAARGRQP